MRKQICQFQHGNGGKEVKKEMIKKNDIQVFFEDYNDLSYATNERFRNDLRKAACEELNNGFHEATSVMNTLRNHNYRGEVPSISLVSGKIVITVSGFIDPVEFSEEEYCLNQ